MPILHAGGTNWASGDMSADITSDGYLIERIDNVGAEITWTGTPTGTISFQVSNSSTNGVDGSWLDITVSLSAQPDGSAGGTPVDFNNLPWRWLRVIYTKSEGTGTGTLTVIFSGKNV